MFDTSTQEHDKARLWRVDLPEHPSYTYTNLKRNFAAADARRVVVIVDARRLFEAATRDTSDYVLDHVRQWYPGKVRGIRQFLDPNAPRVPEMPYVTVRARRCGFLYLGKEGVVAFRNGQHRARYMLDAGAKAFPVEVDVAEAEWLERFCGAAEPVQE